MHRASGIPTGYWLEGEGVSTLPEPAHTGNLLTTQGEDEVGGNGAAGWGVNPKVGLLNPEPCKCISYYTS